MVDLLDFWNLGVHAMLVILVVIWLICLPTYILYFVTNVY